MGLQPWRSMHLESVPSKFSHGSANLRHVQAPKKAELEGVAKHTFTIAPSISVQLQQE